VQNLSTPTRGAGAAPPVRQRTREAWTAFWQEPGQSRCVAAAADVSTTLDRHWTSFAPTLPAGSRVLDLGCGAGAVARALLEARGDIHVTGVDFARIPLTLRPRMELLADTAMESLPFADGSFAAATSQFGFEYGHTAKAAPEMTRVLAPGATFSFLVHHAGSLIVAADRARLDALHVFLAPKMRDAFCAGEAAFAAQLTALRQAHPDDALIAELARALPLRLSRPERERRAIWTAVEDALAPEVCLAEALNACCVAPGELDRWTEALRGSCELRPISVLPDPAGPPLAWIIEGARRS
jgi:SAM-dependent methyltransferase